MPRGGRGRRCRQLAGHSNQRSLLPLLLLWLPRLLLLLRLLLLRLLGLAGTRPSIHQSMRTSTVRGMSATNVAMVAQCQTENLMGIFESRALFFEEQRLIQCALNMGYKDKDNQQQLKGK